MKLTNHHDLPETLFRAVLNDKYSRGGAHYSATDLIRPPRITILTHRYWEQIEEDVSDRIWSLLGKAVHAILEAADPDDALTEERLYAEVDGYVISGASDLYHDSIITDYKVTSVWSRVFGSRIEQWSQQLNVYAYLFRQAGFDVEKLRVVCIYRDWSANKAIQNRRLPQLPAETLPIALWAFERQVEFVRKRHEWSRRRISPFDPKRT